MGARSLPFLVALAVVAGCGAAPAALGGGSASAPAALGGGSASAPAALGGGSASAPAPPRAVAAAASAPAPRAGEPGPSRGAEVAVTAPARRPAGPRRPAVAASPASRPTAAVRPKPPTFDMPYPPATAPRAGDIFHVATGVALSASQALDLVAAARLVCVGETHDNPAAHRVELEVIRALQRRFPGKIAIGMEMFRTTQQRALDRWTRGQLTWTEFLREARWYSEWGSDSRYYRDILELARRHHIDVIALNPPRELQREVRRRGLAKLPPALRAQLPELGPPDPYQRAALQAVFGAHVHGHVGLDALLRVQQLWEESMATRVVDYLRSARGRGKRMVTLTGGWHVKYGFGLPRLVMRRHPLPYVIVLPEEVSIPPDKRDRVMHYELPPLPLLPADLVWMVDYEDLPGGGRLGVRVGDDDGAGGAVLAAVTPGSPAARAGLARGDRVVAVAGRRVRDRTDLLVALEGKTPGTELSLTVRGPAGARTVTLRLAAPPVPSHRPPPRSRRAPPG